MRSILLALLLAGSLPLCAAEVRHALVMGVWEYEDPKFTPLPGIESDVAAMAARLRELGFDVTLVTNPTLGRAKTAVDEFGAKLKAGGTSSVGLFYFSGHGCESEGKNFLVPKGTSITARADLDDEALSAQRVLTRMEDSGGKVNLVFLDCCRNTFSKGNGDLAAMQATGTFIGFATATAKEANASNRGSPYTAALIEQMGQPGLSITDMHTRVTRLVKQQTSGDQVPFQYSGLDTVYYIVEGPGATNSGSPKPSKPALPKLDSVLAGKYVYGSTYGDRAGQFVSFKLTLTANGQAFSGEIDEPYSGFGTTGQDGRMHADVVGSLRTENGKTSVRFTKEYRHHVQPIVRYQGVLDPSSGIVSGTWNFPSNDPNSSQPAGTFTLEPKP